MTKIMPPEWESSERPVAYPDAVKAMEDRVDEIIAGSAPQKIWFLEHPSVYTAGTSASLDELKDATSFPIYESGRGGRYTYHGPGQRIIYAMIDLRDHQDLRAYIWRLEEWVISVLSDFGLTAERRDKRIGLWMTAGDSEEKIAAIGVRVKKWVAYHGIALNVDPDLTHFNGIVPCGIADFGATSMRKLGVHPSMQEIDRAFKKNVATLMPGLKT